VYLYRLDSAAVLVQFSLDVQELHFNQSIFIEAFFQLDCSIHRSIPLNMHIIVRGVRQHCLCCFYLKV
jgi:hypothetical protein